MNQQHLSSARNIFFIMLAIDAILNAAIGWHDYGLLTQLKEVQAGTRHYTPELATALTKWENAGYLSFLSLLGVGAALVYWLRSCYAYAENEIGCTDLAQKKYVIWGWLPILNIFKPYQVLNEIFRAGGSRYSRSSGLKNEDGSSALLPWWIFWVVTHLVLVLLNRAYVSIGTTILFNEGHLEAGTLIKSSIAAYDYSVWIAVISTAISLGWLWVSNLLTERFLQGQPIGADKEFQATIPSTRVMPTATPVTARTSPLDASNNEEIWAKALHEFEHGERRLGLWSKVFAEANGDEGKAKAAYLKERTKQLLQASQLNNLETSPPTNKPRQLIAQKQKAAKSFNLSKSLSKFFYGFIAAFATLYSCGGLISLLFLATGLVAGDPIFSVWAFLLLLSVEILLILIAYFSAKKYKSISL